MNKARRQLIAKATQLVEQAKEMLEQARDEEQEYYDNMPQSIQEGTPGDVVAETIETLDESAHELDEALDTMSRL